MGYRGCPDATCLERFTYVSKRWSGTAWLNMKLFERRAWMMLQHSQSSWDVGNLPATLQKRWNELTPEQRDAAVLLGHSEGTWQGCNVDWTGRVAPAGNSSRLSANPHSAVRGRMTIDRPFSEISGNTHGQQVSTMPSSFVRVFEDAVARALFCGNPPLSYDPKS